MNIKRFTHLQSASVLTGLGLFFVLFFTIASANDSGTPTDAVKGQCDQHLTLSHEELRELREQQEEALYTTERILQTGATIRYYAGGRVPEGAVVRILAIHGIGATTSGPKSMNAYLRTFTNAKRGLKSKSVTKSVQRKEQELFGERETGRYVGVEAIALPGGPMGPELDDRFNTVDSTSDWIVEHIRLMKAQTPQLPIMILTRSAGAIFAENIVRRYPGLVSGLILTSPTMPEDELNRKAREHLEWEEREGIIRINWTTLNWIMSLFKQSKYQPDSFSQVPSLILTGGQDAEMDDIERRFYQQLADAHPNTFYKNIVESGHDVVRDSNRMGYTEDMVKETFSMMLDHIARVVKRN